MKSAIRNQIFNSLVLCQQNGVETIGLKAGNGAILTRLFLWTLFVLTNSVNSANGQHRIDEYKASNGVIYHVGDTIKLGHGSAKNGDFLWLQMAGWGAVASHDSNQGTDQHNIGRFYAGANVTIKKIKSYPWRGQQIIHFTIDGGNITNYDLRIEDAIASCEVAACNKQSDPDKYDKLAKLKGLLDSGAITQQEFDMEKKKILGD